MDETDYVTVPGQIFACLSVVGPECPQKNDKFGLKIRGCFSTNPSIRAGNRAMANDSGRTERSLAAILAADVVGYSRLVGADEEDTVARLRTARREVIEARLARHRGRLFKTNGDGFLAEFASVVDALRAAVEIQQDMARREASQALERRLSLRIGVHIGDVMVEVFIEKKLGGMTYRTVIECREKAPAPIKRSC